MFPEKLVVIAGRVDVVRLMLEAGAKVYHQNSVGRTASQMAAFVGSYISRFFQSP